MLQCKFYLNCKNILSNTIEYDFYGSTTLSIMIEHARFFPTLPILIFSLESGEHAIFGIGRLLEFFLSCKYYLVFQVPE